MKIISDRKIKLISISVSIVVVITGFKMVLPPCLPVQHYYQPLAKFNSDTMEYLRQNFGNIKNLYEGESLDGLLNKLEIPIISYAPMSGGNYVEGNEERKTIGVSFYFNKNISLLLWNALHTHGKSPKALYVFFKYPFSYETSLKLIRQYHMRFSDSARSFYGKLTVDKIDVRGEN